MAYVNYRVIAPVSIYDLQRCVTVTLRRIVEGVTQTKIAGSLGLIISANVGDTVPDSDGDGSWTVISRVPINMWARYKPIRYECIGPVSFATRKNLTYDGVSTPFGVLPPWCGEYRIESGGTVYHDVMNGKVWSIIGTGGSVDNGWHYMAPQGDRTPQGGFKEFNRITDFCRNPSEMTQAASEQQGDPTPTNLKGYNHNAKVPFYPVISMEGIMEEYNGTDGYYLQINKQISNTLTITFYNAAGDDLHLQDFIDVTYADGNKKWRPVLQIFDDYINLNSSNPNDRLPWYQRDNIGTNDMEVSGAAISADESVAVTIQLSLDSFSLNQLYHVCIGVGCCDQSTPLGWKSGSDNLFIMPFSAAQYAADDFPFYKKFKVVTFPRLLRVTNMLWYRYNVGWVTAGGTAPYFEIEYNASGALRLTLTINKDPNQALDFIPSDNDNPDSGFDPLVIKAQERITGQSSYNMLQLRPADSSWQEPGHYHIPTGPGNQTETFYAAMNIGNIPQNGYGEYHLLAWTGATESGQNIYNDIGYFSIHRIS